MPVFEAALRIWRPKTAFERALQREGAIGAGPDIILPYANTRHQCIYPSAQQAVQTNCLELGRHPKRKKARGGSLRPFWVGRLASAAERRGVQLEADGGLGDAADVLTANAEVIQFAVGHAAEFGYGLTILAPVGE